MDGSSGTISAFLSHSYTDTDVNLFFHKLLSQAANMSFRVDRGKSATSTTRLERMIRDASVFLGVWPVAVRPGDRVAQAELMKSSRYFRLELDIAIRAKKPGIVFSDARYGNTLRVPSYMTHVRYDAQEIRHLEGSAHWNEWKLIANQFFSELRIPPPSPTSEPSASIGFLIRALEDTRVRSIVSDVASELGRDLVPLSVPFDATAWPVIRSLDWVVSMVGDRVIDAARSFLYGQAVPVMRIQRLSEQALLPELESALFPYLDAGYNKDIVRWGSDDELRSSVTERFTVILEEPRLLGGYLEAEEYFAEAAKRKSVVFLSYAGEDQDIAAEVAHILRRKFREVFDYRDRSSIRVGEPWQDQLDSNLA